MEHDRERLTADRIFYNTNTVNPDTEYFLSYRDVISEILREEERQRERQRVRQREIEEARRRFLHVWQERRMFEGKIWDEMELYDAKHEEDKPEELHKQDIRYIKKMIGKI